MWQRLLRLIGNQPEIIERLSEVKVIKRAAQITVASYQSFVRQGVKSIEGATKVPGNSQQSSNSQTNTKFFNNFKKEFNKEYTEAKKKGLL